MRRIQAASIAGVDSTAILLPVGLAYAGDPPKLKKGQRLQVLVERSRAAPDFRFALLFLQLDRFQLVNDTLGHVAGDDMLIGLSRRLRNALPKSTSNRARGRRLLR